MTEDDGTESAGIASTREGPTAAELRGGVYDNYVPESSSAKHPHGVLYQGEFETVSDGTAQAVRLHARALAQTGIPVLLRSFSGVVVGDHGVAEPVALVGLPEEVEAEVSHLLKTDIAEVRPIIKHLVILTPEQLRRVLIPRGVVQETIEQQMVLQKAILDSTIVYSVWERDRIDPAIARQLTHVKQCWVPCRHNARLLVDSGVPEGKVFVVPHPYSDDDKIHACTRRTPRWHQGRRRFYSIGRWEPRKGFAELIEAFLKAFSAATIDASLTIKYSGAGQWPGYPTPDEALARAVDRAPREHRWTLENARLAVKLIGGRVKRSQIVGYHLDGNIYVSSSHGEAWNLPAFDARLAGNRLVYVGWGGVCDFAGDEDISVPTRLEPADPSYHWERGAAWAGYQIEDLAEGLRRARIPESFHRPADFEQRFSLAAVGKTMRDLVDAADGGRSLLPRE